MTDPAFAARTDMAHEHWGRRWATEAGRADWLTPEPDVAAAAQAARAAGARRALDLGCGVGRHALMFARLGFETEALDAAPQGLAELRRQAEAEGLAIGTAEGLMTDLPYADASFDVALSFNVIYHGAPDIVARTVAEIRRVLKPGGLCQTTLLSKRNAEFGQGREVAPDTWAREAADPDDDKDHPHFYCDAVGALRLFAGFEPWRLEDREHSRPGSWHWHLAAQRGA